MKLGTTLLISVMVLWRCTPVRSCYAPMEMSPADTICTINEDVDGRVEDLRNITWTIMNAMKGTVQVQFPFLSSSVGLHDQCPKKYTLTLKVKVDHDFLDHSEHRIWIVKNGSQDNVYCDKVGKVIFNYVYTGNYSLHIKVGCYCEIRTSVVKEIITSPWTAPQANKWTAVIIPQHHARKVTFNVYNIDTALMEYTLKYKEICSAEHCEPAKSTTSKCLWGVGDRFHQNYKKTCTVNDCSLVEGTTIECSWTMGNLEKNSEEISYCGNSIMGKYIKDEGNYVITVANVSSGCYCITASKVDSRIEGKNSLWGNMCKVAHSPFVSVEPIREQSGFLLELKITPLLPIVLPAIVICLAAICLPLLWSVSKRRNVHSNSRFGKEQVMHQNKVEDGLVKVSIEATKLEVLLIYPHDCEPFMQLMKQFRELLKITFRCEVFDYHDKEHAAEMNKKGNSWLLEKIHCPRTRVVLVESICAVLYQQAHFGGVKIYPTNLQCTDSLFMLAMTVLRIPNKLQHVFVIRFDHDLAEETSLLCISESVRYVMPENLKKFLVALGCYASEEQVQVDHKIEKEFISSIENFTRYRKKNKDYLVDLYKKC